MYYRLPISVNIHIRCSALLVNGNNVVLKKHRSWSIEVGSVRFLSGTTLSNQNSGKTMAGHAP
jgi:hypothetical protein